MFAGNVSGKHWTVAAVRFESETIVINIYDSAPEFSDTGKCFDYLQQYLKDEWSDKRGPTPFPYHFHPKEVTIPVAVGIVKSFNSRTGAIRENFDFEVARNIAGTKVFRPDVYDVQG